MQQQGPVNTDQLKEQIRQTVREAQQTAQQAAKAAQDARAQTGREIITIPPVGPVIVGPSGTTVPISPELPRAVAPIAISFFVMLGFVIVFSPFVRAIARKIDKAPQRQPELPNEVRQQLQQLSASVEAIAIEVERISEGQRFTTKLLTEKPSSLAEPGSQRSTP